MSDQSPTIDLVPLTDLIDDVTRRNADLAAAAAMWQTRNAYGEPKIAGKRHNHTNRYPGMVAPAARRVDTVTPMMSVDRPTTMNSL